MCVCVWCMCMCAFMCIVCYIIMHYVPVVCNVSIIYSFTQVVVCLILSSIFSHPVIGLFFPAHLTIDKQATPTLCFDKTSKVVSL